MKIREALRSFEAYGWETPTYEIAQKTGLAADRIVRLDTNTSPYKPRAALSLVAKSLMELEVNQYPDTSYHDLRLGISSYTGKDIDRFVVTNGADEGLDIVTKVLLDPGDEVIVPTPTYPMYRITSQIMAAKVVAVTRRKPDFGLDIEGILRAVSPRTKVIFLCNPNNPTGNFSPVSEVEELATRSGAVVMVDEAYFEFCGKSAIDLTDRHDNVIVCRTLSKAFSLAGARVGYLVARKDTVDELNLVRPPNSLTVTSLMMGRAALSNLGEMREHVDSTVSERARLMEQLRSIPGVDPYHSDANFILFRLSGADPNRVHQKLMEKGLVLRNPSSVAGLEGCLRTTVATPDINDRLLRELRAAVSSS